MFTFEKRQNKKRRKRSDLESHSKPESIGDEIQFVQDYPCLKATRVTEIVYKFWLKIMLFIAKTGQDLSFL